MTDTLNVLYLRHLTLGSELLFALSTSILRLTPMPFQLGLELKMNELIKVSYTYPFQLGLEPLLSNLYLILT